jgi:hypothetical protein
MQVCWLMLGVQTRRWLPLWKICSPSNRIIPRLHCPEHHHPSPILVIHPDICIRDMLQAYLHPTQLKPLITPLNLPSRAPNLVPAWIQLRAKLPKLIPPLLIPTLEFHTLSGTPNPMVLFRLTAIRVMAILLALSTNQSQRLTFQTLLSLFLRSPPQHRWDERRSLR